MRDQLSKALATPNDANVDRILAQAFYRARPLQAALSQGLGTVANVVSLSERRQSFLAAGPQGHGGTTR